MKPFITYLGLALFLIQFSCLGQERTINDPDASFIKARDIAFNGERKIARDSLYLIIDQYPKYVDASILIAKTHSWDKDYEEARKQLNRITSIERKRKEAWLAAIRNEIYAKNYSIAMGLANKALIYLKNDEDFEVIKVKILEEKRKQSLILNTLKEELEQKETTNALAIRNSLEVFDDVFDPMFYTSLEFKKNTSIGNIIPRINFSQRFDVKGLQYELDFYPKFSQTFHGYLNYAYSNAVTYPTHKAGAEIYMELPKAMEASLGGRYLSFADDAAIILTGSLGLYSGNYYITGRPYLTFRDNNQLGVSGNFIARRYFKDGNNYVGLNMSYGFDSELNQFISNGILLSETVLNIESQNLRLEYQFSDKKGNNLYQPFIGITRQELTFNPNNFIWSVRLGLQYQINF